MSMITGTHYDGIPQLEVKGIVCLTCEENSQEGSDIFSLKGAIAHCQKYYRVDLTPGAEKSFHGGFEEKDFQAEYIATIGGYVDGPGSAYE